MEPITFPLTADECDVKTAANWKTSSEAHRTSAHPTQSVSHG